LVIGVNWEGEGGQRGNGQKKKAVDDGVAHLERSEVDRRHSKLFKVLFLRVLFGSEALRIGLF
jgi:hypothetical protein